MNNILVRIGACAVISAFGTAILVPALRLWSNANVTWWLLFVLAAGIAIGSGVPALRAIPRVFLSLIPSACLAAYIAFRVVVLRQSIGMSGITSNNPQFWILIGSLLAITWPFTFFSSYCKSGVAIVAEFLIGKDSPGRVETASKVITAFIALISVIGLLLKAVGVLGA